MLFRSPSDEILKALRDGSGGYSPDYNAVPKFNENNQNPTIYKKNFAAGSKKGKPEGVRTGFKWITNAKIEVE